MVRLFRESKKKIFYPPAPFNVNAVFLQFVNQPIYWEYPFVSEESLSHLIQHR